MALIINVDIGTTPKPQHVADTNVKQQARAQGHPNANEAIAITKPVLNVNQKKLKFERRRNKGKIEFCFQSGVLKLTLKQTVLMSKKYSTCERGIWAKHEQDHVKDNQDIAKNIEKQIKTHPKLKTIFYTPKWQLYSSSSFTKIQKDIQKIIGEIFRDLTAKAVIKRDTIGEYAKFQRKIIKTCKGPFYHKVKSGQTLQWIAWYYYGNNNSWKPIYEANKKVIGNTQKTKPGQSLVIPKNR